MHGKVSDLPFAYFMILRGPGLLENINELRHEAGALIA